MGEVLSFHGSSRAARHGGSAPAAGGAQILFFLGVRYERWSEAPPDASSRPRSASPTGRKSVAKGGKHSKRTA